MNCEEMLDAVGEAGSLPAGSPAVVMLSGGRDSVCLLDLTVRLLGPRLVTALHANYRLREDSDVDEAHCRTLCERLDVRLEVERPKRPQDAGNLQAWARDVRYGAAASLARASGALIATGHTAGDQVETILYRLASSPSRRALLGMRRRDGKLVRPLLAFSREETTRYCEERGLSWRDDPTNAEMEYARNRVRHRLLPAFEEIHPAAARNLLRTAELLRDEAEVLDALVEAELGRSGDGTIALERLGELPPPLRRLVVQRLADDAAGRPVPGAANHADEVAALRRTGRAMVDLGRGVRAVVEGGILHAEAPSR